MRRYYGVETGEATEIDQWDRESLTRSKAVPVPSKPAAGSGIDPVIKEGLFSGIGIYGVLQVQDILPCPVEKSDFPAAKGFCEGAGSGTEKIATNLGLFYSDCGKTLAQAFQEGVWQVCPFCGG